MCSNAREAAQGLGNSGRGNADSEADQRANRWGRNGGDPNRYRPNGLPKKYWKEDHQCKRKWLKSFYCNTDDSILHKKTFHFFYYILTIIVS